MIKKALRFASLWAAFRLSRSEDIFIRFYRCFNLRTNTQWILVNDLTHWTQLFIFLFKSMEIGELIAIIAILRKVGTIESLVACHANLLCSNIYLREFTVNLFIRRLFFTYWIIDFIYLAFYIFILVQFILIHKKLFKWISLFLIQVIFLNNF